MAAGRQGVRFQIRSAGAIALLAFVAVACGGGGTSVGPGASAGSGEATATPGGGQTAEGLCGAVTAEMAVAALGGPVGEPQGGDVVPRPNGIYCHYALAADENVNVEAQLKEMTQAEFEATATQLEMSEPLEGVGEKAYQKPNGIMGLPGTTIFVFGGGRGVSVAITAEGDAADQLAAAIDIAEAALAT